MNYLNTIVFGQISAQAVASAWNLDASKIVVASFDHLSRPETIEGDRQVRRPNLAIAGGRQIGRDLVELTLRLDMTALFGIQNSNGSNSFARGTVQIPRGSAMFDEAVAYITSIQGLRLRSNGELDLSANKGMSGNSMRVIIMTEGFLAFDVLEGEMVEGNRNFALGDVQIEGTFRIAGSGSGQKAATLNARPSLSQIAAPVAAPGMVMGSAAPAQVQPAAQPTGLALAGKSDNPFA